MPPHPAGHSTGGSRNDRSFIYDSYRSSSPESYDRRVAPTRATKSTQHTSSLQAPSQLPPSSSPSKTPTGESKIEETRAKGPSKDLATEIKEYKEAFLKIQEDLRKLKDRNDDQDKELEKLKKRDSAQIYHIKSLLGMTTNIMKKTRGFEPDYIERTERNFEATMEQKEREISGENGGRRLR